MSSTPLFLRALRGEATPRPPLWVMRQAGRYLPEYRAVRKDVSFLDLCKAPKLACEVTLQPIRRFGFDAAILFSDLLIPLEAMGLPVTFTEEGPRLPETVRTPADVGRLHVFDAAGTTGFVLETIRQLRASLGDTPLIGFAGAPYTVATYAIEGKTGKAFAETKRFLYREPAATKRLLGVIADATAAYLEAQVAAGAQALQLFDSWVGSVAPEDWDEVVAPVTRALVERLRRTGVPVIYFANGATSILRRVAAVGADAYQVDWRLPLDEARAQLEAGAGRPVVVQGNLDPCVLFGPADLIERRTREVIARGGGRGHVMNLGRHRDAVVGRYPQ